MKYTTVSARLTLEEKEELEKFAKQNVLKMSQIIRKAIKEYIENNDEPEE